MIVIKSRNALPIASMNQKLSAHDNASFRHDIMSRHRSIVKNANIHKNFFLISDHV